MYQICVEEVSNSIMEGGEEGVERIEFEDSKDLQQQSKAFDKLTDRVEDRQLDSTRVQEVSFYSFLFLLLLSLLFSDYYQSFFLFNWPIIIWWQAMASIAASAQADWNAMRLRSI